MSRKNSSVVEVLRKDGFVQDSDQLPTSLISKGTRPPNVDDELKEVCALVKLAVGEHALNVIADAVREIGVRSQPLKLLARSLTLLSGEHEISDWASRMLGREAANFLAEIAPSLLMTEDYSSRKVRILATLGYDNLPRAREVAQELLANLTLFSDSDQKMCKELLENPSIFQKGPITEARSKSEISDDDAREVARIFEISRVARYSRESDKVLDAIARLAKEDPKIAAPLLVVVARTEGREFQVAALERLQAIAPDIARLVPNEPKYLLDRLPIIMQESSLKFPKPEE